MKEHEGSNCARIPTSWGAGCMGLEMGYVQLSILLMFWFEPY